MAYNHLTINELIWIEQYHLEKVSVAKIAKKLNRTRQTIYNVINFIKDGHTIIDFHERYKKNKSKCGRKKKELSPQEKE